MTVGFGIWEQRLAAALEVVRTVVRHLADDETGPLSRSRRTACSGIWQDQAGEHFRDLIVQLQRCSVDAFAEHLHRMGNALEQLHTEAWHAAQAERVNMPPPAGIDIAGGLVPWRRWPCFGSPLGPGWDGPPRSGRVSMDIEAVRGLARCLREASEDFTGTHLRLRHGLDHIEISPPPVLEDLAGAAAAVSNEIRRRADAMEAADRQVVAAASGLLASWFGPASTAVSRFGEAVRRVAATVAEQRALATDGAVPVGERYAANKWLMRYEVNRLETRREKLRERIAKKEANLSPGDHAAMHDIAWASLRLGRLEEKAERFRSWADDPDRNFLLFDPRGDGRVAEVFGDLEGAENVAVIVPGMGNEVANFDGKLRANGQNLQGVAGPETATIAWLGYDTPEGVDGAFGHARDKAAKSLATFVGSLSGYGDKHTTVIGHSYGSTVVAAATAHRGMVADELVLVGSPGISKSVPEGWRPPAGTRLWYGETGKEPISDWMYTFHGSGPGYFDATRFSTAQATGHSDYFKADTVSLENIAFIAQGRYDKVHPH
ncbi:MAG: alpha/beta hydrolase [Acidimicrobiales bacterium]